MLRLLAGKLVQSSGLVATFLLVGVSSACRADSILLSDLLKSGASIASGDLRFEHFSLLVQDNENAPTPDPGKIAISPFIAGEHPGLQFTPSTGLLEVAGTGAAQSIAFRYDATVTGPSKAIAGSTISLAGRAVGNAFGGVDEDVTMASKKLLENYHIAISGIIGDSLSDSGAFPPQSRISITSNIFLQSNLDRASSRIDQFTQTFQVVPASPR